MGSVIKVENFKANMIFDHGVLRSKLKLTIYADLNLSFDLNAPFRFLSILMSKICVGLKISELNEPIQNGRLPGFVLSTFFSPCLYC